jgi:hypothetical protein
MNMTERLARLDTMLADGLLIRGRWRDLDAQDREHACLLAALSPEAGSRGTAYACPADVMPPWLAKLTPWIDDSGTLEQWPDVTRRYAAVAHRWIALTDLDWAKLQWRVRGICIREAVQHTKRADVVRACEMVIALADMGARDGTVDENRRRAAVAAANAAAYAAVSANDAAAANAADAANAAVSAYAAAAAAAAAAVSAAAAAAYAAVSAAAAAAANAADAARQKAADRIIGQILTAIEESCTARESAQ